MDVVVRKKCDVTSQYTPGYSYPLKMTFYLNDKDKNVNNEDISYA
jgi:hypothetical protein